MLSTLALIALRFTEDSVVKELNPDDVTPGVIGFAFTAVFAIAVILLGVDMYTRMRRMRYRAEVREEISQELAQQQGTDEEQTPSSL